MTCVAAQLDWWSKAGNWGSCGSRQAGPAIPGPGPAGEVGWFNAGRRQNAFSQNSREVVLFNMLLCMFLFLESEGCVWIRQQTDACRKNRKLLVEKLPGASLKHWHLLQVSWFLVEPLSSCFEILWLMASPLRSLSQVVIPSLSRS